MRFGSILTILSFVLVGFVSPVFAQTAGGDLAVMGAAIGIGIAAIGGALGQGKMISAALESIARNPGAAEKMFLPWLLGVVLVESLVIYALIVALKVVGII